MSKAWLIGNMQLVYTYGEWYIVCACAYGTSTMKKLLLLLPSTKSM